MAKKRLFLAADISVAQREAVGLLAENLAKGVRFTRAHPKWVDVAGMHLTLKFLGDVEETRLKAICDAVGPAVAGIAPVQFDLAKLGVFPSQRAPKVLWIGVDHGRKQLKELAGAVETALARIGFQREQRGFFPHLTLARINAVRGASEMMDVVESHRWVELPETTLENVTLYESDLRPEGARYTVLHRWPLAVGGDAD